MKRSRMKPEARKNDILASCMGLAAMLGYTKITRDEIAREANVSGPTLHYHFGTIEQLRRAIMRYAVANPASDSCLMVVAQGLVANDPQAWKADDEIRARAMNRF